jgi:hypothetical protein
MIDRWKVEKNFSGVKTGAFPEKFGEVLYVK